MAKRLDKEITMQLLFQIEAQGLINKNLDKETIENFTNQIIENFYLKERDKIKKEQIAAWIFNIVSNLNKIDQLINETSKHWRIDRMGAIDRAILRLATYLLLFIDNSAYKIIINDAVEMAKRFGNEQSASFVNGILDSIKNKTNRSL